MAACFSKKRSRISKQKVNRNSFLKFNDMLSELGYLSCLTYVTLADFIRYGIPLTDCWVTFALYAQNLFVTGWRFCTFVFLPPPPPPCHREDSRFKSSRRKHLTAKSRGTTSKRITELATNPAGLKLWLKRALNRVNRIMHIDIPAPLAGLIDSGIEWIYSFGPLASTTVVLSKYKDTS